MTTFTDALQSAHAALARAVELAPYPHHRLALAARFATDMALEAAQMDGPTRTDFDDGMGLELSVDAPDDIDFDHDDDQPPAEAVDEPMGIDLADCPF
jgi:hypothetical protein